MRKILSLFAAMLMALVANSAVIQINNSTPDALRLALSTAATGDVIEMAAGTYVESPSDYIAFAGKDVTVKAAEGAEVIIQPQVSITVSEGGCAHFQNVKIDASRLIEVNNWYEHLIYATDAANNSINLQGCELYGFNLNKSMLYCNASNKLATVIINNCYIHNTMKSVLFVENTTDAISVLVANSTFANISTNTESYWAGIIDLRNANATLTVDLCTFYNVIPMNTDYSCVSKITLANGVTTNCIFMLPTAQDGIRAMRGVTAVNCITYNYLKDSGTGIHSSVTKTNCVQVDPLFVDAANGNFTLGANSPALTLNGGQPIGDPRWVPTAPVEPILANGFYLIGQAGWDVAALDSTLKFAVNPANENEYMLHTTLAEGDSIKVVKVESDAIAAWYPAQGANYGVDAAHAGEKDIYFQEAYKADWAAFGGHIWIAENPAPQPIDPTAPYVLKFNGTGSSSDNSNEFKKDGDIFTDACKMYVASVDTISKVYAARIIEGDTSSLKFGSSSVKGYMEFTLAIPTAVDSIVVDATQYGNNATKIAVNGEEFTVNAGNKKAYLCKITPTGIITKITIAQTSSERLYLRSIAVYPKSGDTPEPQPEVHYYMKNNWNAAADWTWKEMTKAENVYKLDSVVFGGTGVNVDVEEATGDAKFWFPIEKISGATIAAKDTVSFVFNPADTTVAATLLGKYVEPAPEPMANPIYKVDFFNRDWSKDSLSTVAWDAENQKVLINVIPGKSDTWQGQLWLKLPMQVKAGKEYDLSFKATADKTFGGTVVKFQQNAEMTIIYDFALTAGQESVYSKENLRGVNGGDSVLCISFGFAPDSTHIELYDIAIVEHEPTTPPAKFFVTGNDAFTVDAGLTTAKSWNPDAFKSETDTIIFNLKAGAEYQIKVCVDGTWNTAKNYNDLTEKAPGLIDADGNNHNIGFSLAADGPVKVIYTADVFKLEGNFYVAPKLTTCAEVYDMAKNDEVALNPVTVTYVNGKNIYVMDATAGMLIYLPKNGSWKIGDKLSGVEGKVDIYNGIYEVKMDSAQVAAVVADSGAAPKPVKVDSITLKDMSKYILVQNIQFADTAKFAEGTASNINIVVAGDTIVLRNNFKNGYTFEPGKKYDIAALVTLYSNKIQLYFVDASEHLDITYYLAGTMNEWKANEAYKFAANPANEGEYMLTTALAVGDKFKVIGVVGTDISWFPTGMGNDYVVDSLHAGEAKNIYFRPEGGQQGWYEGFFFVEPNEETMDSIPTTAPAAPTAAEDDVLAIYCNHYTTNNLNFAISGWAGGYETLTIDSTKIGFWTNMTWECIIDPAPNTDNAHDFSAYKKLHVDLWAPKSAKIKFTVEAVAGGNYKDGNVVNLVKGWNCCDFVVAEWPDNYDFTNVKCFVLEQYQTPAGESFEGNPFAFANIYFYEKESQALDNTSDGVKAVKYIRNGMILIEKNGKVYTITGQVVR